MGNIEKLPQPGASPEEQKHKPEKRKLPKILRTAGAVLAFLGMTEAGAPALAQGGEKTKEKPGATMAELISRSQELEKNIIRITNEKGLPGKINGIDSKILKTDKGKFTLLLDKNGLPAGAILELRDGEKRTFYLDGGTGQPDALPDKLVFDNQKSGLQNSDNKRSAEGTLEVLSPIEDSQKNASVEADLSPRDVSALGIKRNLDGGVESIKTADFNTGTTGQLDDDIEQRITAQTIQEQFRNGLSKFSDGL